MRVKIIQKVVNNFGVFEAGRECELPPNMLARFTKESFEEIETGTESEVENDNDKVGTDSEAAKVTAEHVGTIRQREF